MECRRAWACQKTWSVSPNNRGLGSNKYNYRLGMDSLLPALEMMDHLAGG
jgi:hypothetical protein